MALNDRYTEAADGVADTGDLIVDASGTGTGVVRILELGGTGDAEVYREIDIGQTGTFEVSDKIADPADNTNPTSGQWHSQDNWLNIGNDGTDTEARLRIVNVSGASADYYAIGYETGGTS